MAYCTATESFIHLLHQDALIQRVQVLSQQIAKCCGSRAHRLSMAGHIRQAIRESKPLEQTAK